MVRSLFPTLAFAALCFATVFSVTACRSAARNRERTEEALSRRDRMYGERLASWPVEHEEVSIPTRFGPTRAVVSGPAGGPCLILVHAMGTNALTWSRNIEALSSRMRVYALDTIGDFGGMSGPLTRAPEKPSDYADWMGDIIDSTGRKTVDIMGCSMGGWITLLSAYGLQDRVGKIVLISPAAGIPASTTWGKLLSSMLMNPSETNIRKQFSILLGDSEAGKDWTDYITIIAKYGASRSKLVTPKNLKKHELESIRMPVLLLVGDKETIYRDREEVFSNAEAALPDVRVMSIPGAGHLGAYDNPEFVNAAVTEFLE